MSWPYERSAHRLALAFALASAGAGCSARSDAPPKHQVPPGAFAVVGARPLGLDLLRRAALGTTPSAASEALVSDALLALASRALAPERAVVVERGQLVRGLLDLLRKQALERAPARPEELDAARKELWAELDRPRCVRTINVMAIVPPFGDGQREESVMRRIAAEVEGAATPEELGVRVNRAAKDGVEVTMVVVPPVTEDGRVYLETPADAAGPVPPLDYARATGQLTHVGETSGLVSTEAGYHVIMAIDIVPAVSVAEPEQSQRLRKAVADRRIAPELEQLERELSTRTSVWQNPHRAALTSLVWRTDAAQGSGP